MTALSPSLSRADVERVVRSVLQKQLGPAAEPALAAAGIEPTMRAEQLDVAAFCRLSEAFRTLGFDLRMSG